MIIKYAKSIKLTLNSICLLIIVLLMLVSSLINGGHVSKFRTILSVATFPACSASPGTININGQVPYPTISAAINAANTGDTICVGPGTYHESLYIDKYIVLESSGGNGQTVISPPVAEPAVVFQNVPFTGGIQARLIGFTVTGGYSGTNNSGEAGGITLANADVQIVDDNITQNSSVNPGGGMIVYNSSPVIYSDMFSYNNSAQYGGGILIVGSSNPSVDDSSFIANSAYAGGGAWVDSGAQPVFFGDNFQGNVANGSNGGGEGGGMGMRLNVHAIVQATTFSNNSAYYGGAVDLETGGQSVDFTGDTFTSNQATISSTDGGSGYGGAIAIYNSSNASIFESTFTANTAQQGGGAIVAAQNSITTLDRNSFSQNQADSNGGGSNGNGGAINIASNNSLSDTNDCFINNTATAGGAIAVENSGNFNAENITVIGNNGSSSASYIPGGVYVQNSATSVAIGQSIMAQNTGVELFDSGPPVGSYSSDLFYATNSGPIVAYGSNATLVSSIGQLPGNFTSAIEAAVSNSCSQTTGSAAANYGVQAPISSNLEPVYRFFGSQYQVHFFTTSISEATATIAVQPVAFYHYEGIAFYGYASQPQSITANGQTFNPLPVMRYDNVQNPAVHFFSVDPAEEAMLTPNNWTQETTTTNPAFWVYPPYTPGMNNVCRFRNLYNGISHFYTASAAECEQIQTTPSLSSEWYYEGIAFSVPYVN